MLVVAATCICAVQGGIGDPVLDSTDPRLGVKGQYLFHLAKGNDWPEEAKSGPFVVAIHNKPDLVDFFELEVNEDETKYWLDGKWKNFVKKQVTIETKILNLFSQVLEPLNFRR